jgi:hypothetical protein
VKIAFVTPRLELQPCIESFWVLESPTGLPASANSIAAPNGCSKLIIPYENSIVSVADGRLQVSHEQRMYFVGNRTDDRGIRPGYAGHRRYRMAFYFSKTGTVLQRVIHRAVGRVRRAALVRTALVAFLSCI